MNEITTIDTNNYAHGWLWVSPTRVRVVARSQAPLLVCVFITPNHGLAEVKGKKVNVVVEGGQYRWKFLMAPPTTPLLHVSVCTCNASCTSVSLWDQMHLNATSRLSWLTA